jgi:hypothetical protein
MSAGSRTKSTKRKEKTREKSRLKICGFFGLKEIRMFVYPHSSFTRGRVKYGFKYATHPQPTISCLF